MKGEVGFHEDAVADYEAAFEWYFLRSEFVASRFAEEMNRAIATISEAPNRWPTAKHGARKFLLQRFPFAIFIEIFPPESKCWRSHMDIESQGIGRGGINGRYSIRSRLVPAFRFPRWRIQ
jgi:hypothetical protein